MAVALAAFEARPRRRMQKPIPGGPSRHFPRGGHDRIERRGARVNLERAERTHRIHDQALAMTGDDLRNLVQRVEDAGGWFRNAPAPRAVIDGFAVSTRSTSPAANLRVLRVIDSRQLAAEHVAYFWRYAGSKRRFCGTSTCPARDTQRADRGLDRETCHCPAWVRTRTCQRRARFAGAVRRHGR